MGLDAHIEHKDRLAPDSDKDATRAQGRVHASLALVRLTFLGC